MNSGPSNTFPMENIVIVRPFLGKRKLDADILEAFETRTFAEPYLVARPEIVIRPEADVVSELPTAESDDSDEDLSIKYHPSLSPKEFYQQFVERTREQCIAEERAPQRSLAWLNARRHCITASSFGSAAGHNKYEKPDALVMSKLWTTFSGNEFTAYGTFHEPDARDSFRNLIVGPLWATFCRVYALQWPGGSLTTWDLVETGLLKSETCPWIGVSPDGLLLLRGTMGTLVILVEYKCPARLRDSEAHPYMSYPHNIPEYYMDQMQGIAGLLNECPHILNNQFGQTVVGPNFACFVVWQPHQIHVTLVPVNGTYWRESLKPSLEQWYFQKYLPMAVLQYNGLLVKNTLTTGSVITVE